MVINRISIIVPVYNTAATLTKCIDSIIYQSYQNIEILLINDGSTDNSLDICYEYANKDKRVRVFSKENGGASSARNVGLDYSKGEYIGFVDSDDYLSLDMYSKLLDVMLKTGADIVECGHYNVEADYMNAVAHPLKHETLEGNYASSQGYASQRNVRNYLCNKLYKGILFNNIRLPDLKYSEDYVTNVYLHYECQKKIIISDCLYYYVNCSHSMVNQKFSSAHFDVIKAGEIALSFYKDKFSGSLTKYVYVDILNRIRGLYMQMLSLELDGEVAAVLVSKYKAYFTIIKKDLFDILSAYDKRIKIFLVTVTFRYSPKFYAWIYSILRG